jgi:subtilisin family serine protease
MKIIIIHILLVITLSSFAKSEDSYKKELLNKIKAQDIHLKIKKKIDIKIAVIDSGLNTDENAPMIESMPHSIMRAEASFLGGGHGAHVQGIIYLLTNSKNISHYNFYKSIYDDEQVKETILQMNKAIDNNSRVINLSMGGDGSSSKELRAIKRGQRNGAIFVCAAGNSSKNLDKSKNVFYPASYSKQKDILNIISVANFVDKDTIYPDSNHSGSTFIGTYGTRIPSFCEGPSKYSCLMTGTSQATPIITSAVTLLLERFPYLNMKQVKYVLSINSFKTKESLKYTKVGFFSYKSFIEWLNKDYSEKDIFPNNKKLQLKYSLNNNYINTNS